MMKRLSSIILLTLCVQIAWGQGSEEKIKAFIPTIDQLFKQYAEQEKLPSVVYGIVYQGKLIHSHSIGLANLKEKIPASTQMDYRIASMTKSFTTLAILK